MPVRTKAVDMLAVPRPRIGRWRAVALITANLLIIAHIIQWRITGYTLSPVEPAEAMYALQRGAINAGLIFFSLAILTTLLLGRFFCGWACHMVALQDLCGWLLRKIGLRPRPFRSRLLVFVPLVVAFYMFLWPTVLRYFTKPAHEPLVPPFTNQLMTTEFWATFPTVAVAIPFLFICGFMTVWFLGSKGFCTYACPYGGIYKLVDRLSPGKIRVTDACDQCGKCTAVCTSNVRVHNEVKRFGMVVDPDCHRAMDCVSVCPQDALYFGLGKPAILSKGKSAKKAYSLTWEEEIFGACVFTVSFLGVWDVYQLIPMFMAVAIALITTYLLLRTSRLFFSSDVSFYSFHLRSSGAVTRAGWIFLAFTVVWAGLNLHSGWVRFYERRGAIAFESIRIPDELALAQPNPTEWLSRAEKENIARGKASFDKAAAAGLFTNNEAQSKRAWLEFLDGDAENSVEMLRAAAERVSGRPRALCLYYRGAVLNRLGRYEEALAGLDLVLAEHPDLVLARVERGESLWQLGRREAAVEEWQAAANESPATVLADLILAGAAAADGDVQRSVSHESLADVHIPADPYFNWMVALRLHNVGMNGLAQKHFQRAIQLDPTFRLRRRPVGL